MRPIKASELSAYSYCKRSWYYQKQGETNANQAAMREGTRLHGKQGRQVLASLLLFLLGLMILLAAVGLALWNLLK